MTPTEKQQVIDMRSQGKTTKYIANSMHFCTSTIRKVGSEAYENQKARQRRRYAERRGVCNGVETMAERLP